MASEFIISSSSLPRSPEGEFVSTLAPSSQAQQAQELVNLLFANKLSLSGPFPDVSGIVSNHLFVLLDWNSEIRSNLDVATSIASATHATSVLNVLSGPSVAVAYNGMGTTTAFNTILGAAAAKKSFDQMAHAQRIGDKKGTLYARISIAKDLSLTAAGGSFAAYRALAITSAVTGTSASGFTAPTLLGRVTYGSGFIGSALFTIFFGFICSMLGLDIYYGQQFRKKLEKQEGLAEKMEFLQKQLQVDPQAVHQKLLKKAALNTIGVEYSELTGEQKTAVEQEVQKQLIKEAISEGALALKGLITTLGEKGLSGEECEQLFVKILETTSQGTNQEVTDLTREKLLGIGWNLQLKKLELKKEAKLGRLTSGACVKMIRELNASSLDGTSLLERVKAGDIQSLERAKEITDTVLKTISEKRLANSLMMAACIFAAITMVIGFVLTGPVGIIIAAVMMAISSLMQLAIDTYFSNLSLESDSVGKGDKKMLLISTAVCILSALTVLSLMALGVVSFGIVPVALMIVLTIIWLGYNGYIWKKLSDKEEKEKLEHPTLESFHAFLQTQRSKELMDEIFTNLPADVQDLLSEELAKITSEKQDVTSREMMNAAQAAIERIEKIKNEQLEQIRNCLKSFA